MQSRETGGERLGVSMRMPKVEFCMLCPVIHNAFRDLHLSISSYRILLKVHHEAFSFCFLDYDREDLIVRKI